MPTDADKEALRQEAKPLINCLYQLKNDWPSDPALDALTPRMVDALLQYIASEESARPVIAWSMLLGLIAVVIVTLRYSPLLSSMFLLIALTWAYIIRYDPGPGQRCAVYALTQTDDLRVLPTLIQATRFPWGKHTEVTCAIYRLLEQVTEENIGLLSGDAQQKLWYLSSGDNDANSSWNEQWAMRKLQAFAHIGNRDTLLCMQELARTSTRNRSERRIIQMAQQIVPVMEARLRRQSVPQTLLRAASIPAPTADTLLRATHSNTLEPQQQLLRASTSEHSETDA